MASKRALADPRKPSSAPVMAQRRPQIDPRCPRDGPESAPEDPKSPPKRPLESQVASRRNHENAIEASWGLLEHSLLPRSRFRAILGPRFGVILGSSLGPKLGPKTDTFLTSFWAPFWGPKWGPRRPRKLPRWPFDPQKGAKTSSKSLLHGSFSSPLKSCKNIVFCEVFGPPSCPKATRERPEKPHVATLHPQEATKRTA